MIRGFTYLSPTLELDNAKLLNAIDGGQLITISRVSYPSLFDKKFDKDHVKEPSERLQNECPYWNIGWVKMRRPCLPLIQGAHAHSAGLTPGTIAGQVTECEAQARSARGRVVNPERRKVQGITWFQLALEPAG